MFEKGMFPLRKKHGKETAISKLRGLLQHVATSCNELRGVLQHAATSCN